MGKTRLHIDFETYSSVNILTSGAYKYTESIDFEVLLLCWRVNNGVIHTVDFACGEEMSDNLLALFMDPEIEIHGQGVVFERLVLIAIGLELPIWRFHCTQVKAAYCGFPLSLENISKAMGLEEFGKLASGKKLIRFFCVPIKPTKANPDKYRNYPWDDWEKWEEFKKYCYYDVVAESEIYMRLEAYMIPEFERQLYLLDQEINDLGVPIDLVMAKNATIINAVAKAKMLNTLKDLTGLENPNSPDQLKQWLSAAMTKDITSLVKAKVLELIVEAESEENFEATEVLVLRQQSSKTSVKKYTAMLNCACDDNRAHGLFQFYGANRTGRWAGRLIQLQNLPQNHIDFLEQARRAVFMGDFEWLDMICDNIPDVLSQLIRTTFVPRPGTVFGVADFSAIEARVLAWLSGEQWKIDVFETHGKIYEAAAALMFNIPIEAVTKGSDYRTKGKTAELALGYGGAVGAFKNMSGKATITMPDAEIQDIVDKWREVNPEIVGMWKALNSAAIRCIKFGKKIVLEKYKNLTFEHDGKCMTVTLPSGRKLFYQSACLKLNKWGKPGVQYKGMDQKTKKWWWVDTYGGKLTENIIQAIARDCLAFAMMNLKQNGFNICLHVHDEAAAEIPIVGAKESLKKMCDIMGQPIPWAPGLRVPAEGFITEFYKKD